MAAPWQSSDEGEAWMCGDYILVFQREPQTVGETLEAMVNKAARTPQTLVYHFAMTVFYKKHKNPHGPSSRPVLSAGIEQLAGLPNAPIMVGVFLPTSRFNLGEFEAELTSENAKTKLIEVVTNELSIPDKLIRLGEIKSVFGHPETGWEKNDQPLPARMPNNKSGKGCLTALVLIFAIFYIVGII